MFGKRSYLTESTRHRATKASKSHKRSIREAASSGSQHQHHHHQHHHRRHVSKVHSRPASYRVDTSPPVPSNLSSAIVTIVCGRDQRLFAAHEDVLCQSPFFAAACRGQFQEAHTRRIDLPDEEPEIFSCVLEYLYKGDYYPRLTYNSRRDAWELESTGGGGGGGADGMESVVHTSPNMRQANDHHNNNNNNDGAVRGVGGGAGAGAGTLSPAEAVVYHNGVAGVVLKDTVVYCTAEKYGLEELKRLALRKQGLQSGIPCATILASARYAYAHTPDSDAKLRGHYLSLVIRSRNTFKRSGTMQLEMEIGGKFFFDLFVAMCGHLDDLSGAA